MHILKENKIIFINKKQDYTEINTKFSTPHFTSNQILILYKSYQWVELYLFHRYSGIGTIWGNWARIPQITCRDTCKVILSLQLLISHQIRHYSSLKGFCGLSCNCFPGTRVLGQFGETGPKYPKSCTESPEK